MAGNNEAIPSSRAKLFVAPADGSGQPVLMGLVEQFSFDDNPTPELLQGIGDFTPTDGVMNTMSGTFRWGKVHKLDPSIMNAVRPQVDRYTEYNGFDLLLTDPKDDKPIARLIGCLISTFATDVQNGRSIRENVQGVCRLIRRGAEVTRSAA